MKAVFLHLPKERPEDPKKPQHTPEEAPRHPSGRQEVPRRVPEGQKSTPKKIKDDVGNENDEKLKNDDLLNENA